MTKPLQDDASQKGWRGFLKRNAPDLLTTFDTAKAKVDQVVNDPFFQENLAEARKLPENAAQFIDDASAKVIDLRDRVQRGIDAAKGDGKPRHPS